MKVAILIHPEIYKVMLCQFNHRSRHLSDVDNQRLYQCPRSTHPSFTLNNGGFVLIDVMGSDIPG
jgi:hypothetical protein